ncbi:MAG: TerC family protein [Alphaproteobacteria bacterium]|nr:TerC family protein [Alphaproteobacteria bacterium]
MHGGDLFTLLSSSEVWLAFVTLTTLEVVLGVDNIVFIAILAGRLPKEQRDAARQIGLAVALGTRLLLLGTLYSLAHLETKTGLNLFGREISWRDIVLGLGGLFLIYKAVAEMNEAIRPKHKDKDQRSKSRQRAAFAMIIVQIAIIDIVFSIDSVITAIGIAQQIEVMAAAIIVAVFVMMVAINPIAEFIDRHKEIKIVALSFLLLVGFVLIADALGSPVPRGYLYFALGFASLIQVLILWAQASEKQMNQLEKREAAAKQTEHQET